MLWLCILTGSAINIENEILNKFDLLFSWFYARYNRRYLSSMRKKNKFEEMG